MTNARRAAARNPFLVIGVSLPRMYASVEGWIVCLRRNASRRAGTEFASPTHSRRSDMIDETGQVAAVYVQTNEPDANRVLAFGRGEDGALTPRGSYETGGAGDGLPHLTSQGSV